MLKSERFTRVFLTGTNEHPAASRPVRVGATTVRIVDGALRCISLGGRELVRQIDFPVRDENWASLSPEATFEGLTETAEGYWYERHFEVADGSLVCRVIYQISDGIIMAKGEAEARRDFVTNRTGFTILHPIDGFAGHPVTVRYASGDEAKAVMPMRICPSQPIKDIAGLTFNTEGTTLDIDFTGDVFEMEDQRNWSDASYKTYCRPLVEPFSFTLRAGEVLRQSVRIKMQGSPQKPEIQTNKKLTIGASPASQLPELLLAVQEGWLAEDSSLSTLARCGIGRFLVRVTPKNAASLLRKIQGHLDATTGQIDLEILLEDTGAAISQLEIVADACRETGISLVHVMALPEAYLASYQPSSTWPTGLSPEESFEAAKQSFPEASIGGGMLTNFTELNRCRPDGTPSDYVTHTNSATVHAADDESVMQTLETLPHIFRSARTLAGDRGYRLGLTAIGMRSNPYGDAVSPNPDQKRLTMTVWDPRARSLFGAAWAVGALAATEEGGVDAIALASPAGPFGMLSSPGDVARPWFDDNSEAQVYPIFHVLRALAGAKTRLAISGLPEGLAGLAIRKGTTTRLLVSNLTRSPIDLTLPSASTSAVLDADKFAEAVWDPAWLDRAGRLTPPEPITLQPYAVLFSDLMENSNNG
jgi:D-apionolactonase